MKELEIKVEGMTCQHCVKAVEVELEDLGIDSAKVEIGSVSVKYDDQKTSKEEILKAIEEAGYKPVK